MSDEARITVGLPFYNAERTLEAAIRSVFAQSCTAWELILVDDGSTDGSLRIARSVEDPRVRVVSDGRNRGLVDRLNQITSLVCTGYAARMDADDLMHPERLARQVAFLDASPDTDLVGSAIYTIDGAGRLTGVRGRGPADTSLPVVVRYGYAVHPTLSGRTEWFRRNPYDPEFVRAEDHELWCRTCASSRFDKIHDALLFYREAAPVNVAAYVKSARTERKILRRYGPPVLGRRLTARLMAETYLKSTAYRVLTPLGLQPVLLRARGSVPLPHAEHAALQRVLEGVLRTAVPGLDAS